MENRLVLWVIPVLVLTGAAYGPTAHAQAETSHFVFREDFTNYGPPTDCMGGTPGFAGMASAIGIILFTQEPNGGTHAHSTLVLAFNWTRSDGVLFAGHVTFQSSLNADSEQNGKATVVKVGNAEGSDGSMFSWTTLTVYEVSSSGLIPIRETTNCNGP